MERGLRNLCPCCCPHDGEETTESESGSDAASSASFESAEELELVPAQVASSPQPRQCQEWDSLFFTPDMLTSGLESPTAGAQAQVSAKSLKVSTPASATGQMGPQQSLIVGLQSLQMTNSLNLHAANLPIPEMPASTPLLKNFLAKVSMSDVRRAMRAEPFWYCRYLKRCRKCRDIKKYRWSVSSSSGPSGLVRGVRSVMPLPQDLPSWLQKSVQVPSETNATTVVRLDGAGKQPDNEDDLAGIAESQPVILVMQTCSHDAPYGEHFRVQETVRFSRADRGVQLERWVEVIWVKSLPWALGALKRIIESKTVTGAEEADPDVVAILEKAMSAAS